MNLSKKSKGYMMVTLCGIFWGLMFLFAQYLLNNGLTSRDLVSWKLFVGFLILFVYTFKKDRKLLKVDKKTIGIFAIMGLISHSIYNLLIFTSVQMTSIATSVSLLYTSPIYVMIASRILFKEKITPSKIFALIMCVMGVFLTVTNASTDSLSLNAQGIMYGLMSGICFATMNILSKALLSKYRQLTILTYTFGFGFLFSLSFSNPLVPFKMEFDILIWLCIFALGIVPTALSYLLFTTGLSYGVESSKAGMISTIEVPVSVIGSFLVFGENIWGWKTLGIIMVIVSVILLQQERGLLSYRKKLKTKRINY